MPDISRILCLNPFSYRELFQSIHLIREDIMKTVEMSLNPFSYRELFQSREHYEKDRKHQARVSIPFHTGNFFNYPAGCQMQNYMVCGVSIPFHTGNFFNPPRLVMSIYRLADLVSIPFHTGNFFNSNCDIPYLAAWIAAGSQSLFIQGTFSIV